MNVHAMSVMNSYGIKKRKGEYWFQIADPGKQIVTYNEQEFKKCWLFPFSFFNAIANYKMILVPM